MHMPGASKAGSAYMEHGVVLCLFRYFGGTGWFCL